MNTKNVAFAIMMGALGNVLFIISYYTGQIAPGVALDLSLIGVFIAGFYGGPTTGLITGLIAGILPGIMYGPVGNNGILGLIGLPVGKALTGLTTGLLAKGLKIQQRTRQSLITAPTTLLAYVPEGIFTVVYFSFLLPVFVGNILPWAIIATILLKATAEVIVMSVIMAALVGNTGFKNFVTAYFTRKKNKENSGKTTK
jgi:LytS/YehU family sensor histidine kinase